MRHIDINADLGEGGPYDAELLGIVSSCNIACGGHSGDVDSMRTTVEAAVSNSVAIGAHPSYTDPEGFGRRSKFQGGEELLQSLVAQISALRDVAEGLGVRIHHIKPHGALYNDAAADAEFAEIVIQVAAETGNGASIVGLPDSELQRAADRRGMRFLAEAFVDRAYLADGRLVPRIQAGAVHDTLEKVEAQAVSLAVHHRVTAVDGTQIPMFADTLCVHGDTPGAANVARTVRRALEQEGIEISVGKQ